MATEQPLPTGIVGAFLRTLPVVLGVLAVCCAALCIAALVFVVGAPYSGVGDAAWGSVLPMQMAMVLILLTLTLGWAATSAIALQWPEQLRQIKRASELAEAGRFADELPLLTMPATGLSTFVAWFGAILFAITAGVAYSIYADMPEAIPALYVSIVAVICCGISLTVIAVAPGVSRTWNRRLHRLAKYQPHLVRSEARMRSKQPAPKPTGRTSRNSRWAVPVFLFYLVALVSWPVRGLIVAGEEHLRREQFEGNEPSLLSFSLATLYLLAVVSLILSVVIGEMFAVRRLVTARRAAERAVRELSDAPDAVVEKILRPHPTQPISSLLLVAAAALLGLGLAPLLVEPGEFPVHATAADLEQLSVLLPMAAIGAMLVPAAWILAAIGEWSRWRLIARWQERTPDAFVPVEPVDFIGFRAVQERAKHLEEQKRQ